MAEYRRDRDTFLAALAHGFAELAACLGQDPWGPSRNVAAGIVEVGELWEVGLRAAAAIDAEPGA